MYVPYLAAVTAALAQQHDCWPAVASCSAAFWPAAWLMTTTAVLPSLPAAAAAAAVVAVDPSHYPALQRTTSSAFLALICGQLAGRPCAQRVVISDLLLTEAIEGGRPLGVACDLCVAGVLAQC